MDVFTLHLAGVVVIIYQLEVDFALLLGGVGLLLEVIFLIDEFIMFVMNVYPRVVFVALFEEFLAHEFIGFEEVGVAFEVVVVEEPLCGDKFS